MREAGFLFYFLFPQKQMRDAGLLFFSSKTDEACIYMSRYTLDNVPWEVYYMYGP